MVVDLRAARVVGSLLIAAGSLISERCIARPFTVSDDIGFSRFADPDPDAETFGPILFSPDGRFFAVDIERGRIDLDRAESTIRIYRTEDAYSVLRNLNATEVPSPFWTFSLSTFKDGPIISHWHWLADSRGLAFLAKTSSGSDQLFLGDLGSKRIEPLTPQDQHVTAFDIRDRSHFVYTTSSDIAEPSAVTQADAVSVVGTGHSLYELMFPQNLRLSRIVHDRNELWAELGGHRFRVASKGQPVILYTEGVRAFALSPDGQFVIAPVAIPVVPTDWATRYQPLARANPFHIRAGTQDLKSPDGFSYAKEYSLIHLQTGKLTPLVEAPTGESAGWWGTTHVRVAWSDDGHHAILPSTFVPSTGHESDKNIERPCVAVADLPTGAVTCVEMLKGERQSGEYEEGYHRVEDIQFASGDSNQLIVNFAVADNSKGEASYLRSGNRFRFLNRASNESATGKLRQRRSISVAQSYRDPPLLVATDHKTGVSRTILDPNPQLKEVELGDVSIFEWSDNRGRKKSGALYRPPGYMQSKRYPLVVQTHGFPAGEFEPSGVYTTAFAAQELAEVGMVVLQAPDCGFDTTSDEGPCNARGYEAGIDELVAKGVVDKDRMGIIGFSRTCYYVLETLTTSSLRFKAASVTDGLMVGYFQYMITLDNAENGLAHLYDLLIGAQPFSHGLEHWLRRSPEFNMDKVTAPLLVVAPGQAGLLEMWEPYAALRYLHKPVELVLVREGTHVLTNPSERIVSQGGTVDWFRFWLQGYEDPERGKAEQYNRWEKLCDAQIAQNPNQPAFCVRTKTP